MNERGLHDKYTVTRNDGKPVEHPVFILSPETDPAARHALEHYAFFIRDTNPELSQDLNKWLREIRSRNP